MTEEPLGAPTSEFEFCIGPDGALGRRRMLPVSELPLSGEVYLPDLNRWRLAAAVTDTESWPTIDEDRAREEIDDPAALTGPCPDPADIAPHGSSSLKDRLDWLDAAIAATLGAVQIEQKDVGVELSFARPGTWDYDFEIDMIGWLKAAYITLEALIEEKLLIQRRSEMRAGTEYPD